MRQPTELDALAENVRACEICPQARYSHVLGTSNGPAKASVMFVGEAPGRLGAGRSGVPFLGDESGRRFESFLASAGFSRKEVFITNALLCNPVDGQGRNRRPRASDIRRCSPFLQAQIGIVDPAVVVALGGVALEALALIEPHGLRLRDSPGEAVAWHGRRLVALYHPGRRALVHRPEAMQEADWRTLDRNLADHVRTGRA